MTRVRQRQRHVSRGGCVMSLLNYSYTMDNDDYDDDKDDDDDDD